MKVVFTWSSEGDQRIPSWLEPPLWPPASSAQQNRTDKRENNYLDLDPFKSDVCFNMYSNFLVPNQTKYIANVR